MKYERQFIESVEAERIPLNPTLADLVRLLRFTDCPFTVSTAPDGDPVISWHLNGGIVPSSPGDWITKDDENCLTWFTDDDFRSLYREIEPHLSEVLAPFAEYERDEAPEWVQRPPVVAYG